MSNEDKMRDYLKWVTANLAETRQRLHEVQEKSHEPVAIVGMGCRFPGGVEDPEGLWELVAAGTDAVSAFPPDRGWDIEGLCEQASEAGLPTTAQGAFMHDAASFDAGFFGISPREALAMDPQQRLLLETSWEALERAGINPVSLRGSQTGVFAGAAFSGYSASAADEASGTYRITGNATAVISGRISYVLGLEGPAVTVDTACSSALVAVHLACQAIRSGECTMAVAGGVAVMVSPAAFAEFSRQRGLAADGRCKAFAGAADGIGWGEGAGMIVLERLSDARHGGHRVLAVIRGSAVNQDGASNGLTAPNGPSQRRVIRAALAAARVSPADVDAVEAHGTGTVLGDPIEAQALLATYGQERPAGKPLWLGSLKSNIGHTQAASGVASLIKVVQALQHEMLPRTLHVDEPSPHVDWSAGDVRLLTEPVPWPAGEQPRRAGVSGFGVSGTNVHLIVEEAPVTDTSEAASDPAGYGAQAADDGPGAPAVLADGPVLAGDIVAWLVSGKTAAGLAAQAGRLRDFTASRPRLDPADVAWSLATTRSMFEHRAVVIGSAGRELLAGLDAVASGQPLAGVVCGAVSAAGDAGKVVFVFPGQGGQWAGMGTELAAASPVFAARLAECSAALEPYTGWRVEDVLSGAGGAPGLDRVEVVQPALWAVMVSLAAVWQAAGVTPDAVAGHSQGEIAAAVVAGILSLQDAARVVALRSRALTALAGRGGMASVALPAATVRERLADSAGRVQVAAVSGPAATVVSGDRDAIGALVAGCEAGGTRARVLPVDYASHGPQVEELEQEILAALDDIEPRQAEVPMLSAMTGGFLQGPEAGAAYWYASLRAPVEFERSVRALAADGHRVFIEVSPHPVLTGAIGDTLEDAVQTLAAQPVVSGTLRRDDGGPARLLTSLAGACVRGVPVDWAAVLPARQRVDLPTYAFQRRRYWADPVPRLAAAGGDGAGTVAESRFWAAVEGGNLQELARVVPLDGDRPFSDVLPLLASWRRGERESAALADWRYRVSWVPMRDAGPAVLPGRWLLVVPAGRPDLADAVAAAMTAGGARVAVIGAGVGDLERAVLAAAVTAAAGDGEGLAGVVSLLALDETPLPGASAVRAGTAGTLALIQALGDAEAGAPLWVVTCGAVGVLPGEAPARPVQAQAWGLGRAAGVEHPGRWGGLVDLPPVPDAPVPGGGPVLDERTASWLCAVLAGCGEEEVAVRPAGAFARRVVRAPRPAVLPAASGEWRARGTAVVTGAGGAIGLDLAPWLAGRGADRVVLTGRRGPMTPGAAAVAAGLAGEGTEVRVAACDLTDRGQVAGLLAWAGSGGLPVSTVIHCAVAVNLKPLADTTIADLALGLGAKAGGAAILDELLAGPGAAEPGVTNLVLFSSIAATWGVAEHGIYAAANAYLDALAESRRGRGLHATSVAWGVWSSGGRFDQPAAGSAGAGQVDRPLSVIPSRLVRQGLRLLDPGRALAALGGVLAAGETAVAVADVDWERFAPVFTAARHWRLFDEIPEAGRETPPGTGSAATTELAAELSGLGRAERERMITALVRQHAAAVLGFGDESEVEAGRAFRDLGFDSLTAIELRDRLNAATGLALPSTVVFDYPSPVLLARQVVVRLVDDPGAAVTARPGAGAAAGEPVAIVGLGCRFPGGADTPEALWELVAAGGDAVGRFPADRGWDMAGLLGTGPGDQGASYASEGGFVTGAADFDPGFFGISPREALAMDPQQRLLLEVSWEALERVGIDPLSLRGTATGVFAGAAASGYAGQVAGAGTEGLEGHLITGNVTSVISGRVSYVLGLEGPAVTVDTACSSALVAVHLAAQALRAGECDLALAGGVMVIADPAEFVGFSRQGALAHDGRCKAFAAAADGMGLAEGAGMIALERLSDARRKGHRVLAVIAGSAVNQDGASNGLTAPNGPSQQRVIAAALASAGLSPADIDAVEGHGTGTTLGDPIEAQALIAAYGRDRAGDRPLWLGSVKSNIGHTQQASGAAGVIKMVQALQHETLPPTLHACDPTPHVDWSAGQVRLLAEPVPWPAGAGRPRRAGISSFGISGTNAHLIIEEPPAMFAESPSVTGGPIAAAGEPADEAGTAPSLTSGTLIPGESDVTMVTEYAKTPDAAVPGSQVLAPGAGASAWPVSGKTAAALAAQADKLASWVSERPDLDPAGVAWSLATARSVFEHRAVVIGAAPANRAPADPAIREWAPGDLVAGVSASAAGEPSGAMAARLATLAAGQPSAGVTAGSVPPGDAGKVVFVFPGQGGQWAGMGKELAAASPVFAARLGECSAALQPYTGWRLEDVLAGAGIAIGGADNAPGSAAGVPDLERVDVVQPALWAVMVSLAAVWEAAGVVPDAVAGHSQGEIAAAAVAGILSLQDAAKVVALRSRALTALAGRGAMASVALPAAAVPERMADSAGRVQVAAVNGPSATVVSGDRDAIGALVASCEANGIRARVLPVDYASHGPQVEELEAEILTALGGIEPRPARIPMVSAMTGEFLEGPEADAAYWYASLRAPVEFQRSVGVLAGTGHRVFVEASPQPVLTTPVTETLEDLHAEGAVTGTLRRDDGGPARLLASLAAAWVRGAAVNWAAVLPPAPAVDLPTYAFQHQHYWPRRAQTRAVAGGDGAGTEAEARFWAAVEGGDLEGLAGAGALDGERPLREVLPALAAWRREQRSESAVASWRYQIDWVPVPDLGPAALAGTWLLVVPAGHASPADELATAMSARGARVAVIEVDCAVTGRTALAAAIGDALGGALVVDGGAGAAPAGIVSLLASAEGQLPGFSGVPAGLAATASLVQALGDAGIAAPLWVVTSGAVAAVPGDVLSNPAQAESWGLGVVAALEHPDRWGGLLDLPSVLDDQASLDDQAVPDGRAAVDDRTLGRVCAVLSGCGEDQVAIRQAGILARRLVRAPKLGETQPWLPSGTALVTGGTGWIGGHVARWLASRGAPRVVLASRSGPAAAGAASLAVELAAAGTAVFVAACDSARRTDLAGLVDRIAADQVTEGAPPLTAVFHAAGSSAGAALDEITVDGLEDLLAVKAGGAASLDELTADLDLTAFVLFSSGAGTWGSANLAGYAAANAYLDALAVGRRHSGLAATSIAWGLWGGGGMGDGEGGARLQRIGMREMDPRVATRGLAQALDAGEGLLAIADVDWERFAPVFTARRASPLLSGLPEAGQAPVASGTGDATQAGRGAELTQRLAGLSAAGQEEVLTDLVRAHAAAVLGHASSQEVEQDRAFSHLGFDSVTAIELRNRLSAASGLQLPSTLIFDHPTPVALARYLRTQAAGYQAHYALVIEELGKLESVLALATWDDEEKLRISTRLGVMARGFRAAEADGLADVQEFDPATDDEMFDLVDEELRISDFD
jgi:acyl transferase domain-containing protein/acyl carrier protein